MPYYFFMWDEENEEHVRQHGISEVEFEQVVMHPDRVEISRSSSRLIAFGWTATERYLACVYELLDDGVTVYPITAFDPAE